MTGPRGRGVGLSSFVLLLALVTGCDRWVTTPARYHNLEVKVTSRLGTPIPGVRLLLYTGRRPMGTGRTDKTGRHEFEDVPDGEYGVVADQLPSGYHGLEALTGDVSTLYKDGLQVSAKSVPSVVFKLLREGPGTVVARLAKPDGTPLVGIPANLDDQFGHSRGQTTSATGVAIFTEVPYGIYYVKVANPDRFETDTASPYLYSRPVPVDSGSRDSVAVTLTPCTGDITIRVIDGSGRGVPSYPVRLYTSTQILEDTFTDASGNYVWAGLQCGEYGNAIRPKAGYSYTDTYGLGYTSVVVKRGTVNPFVYRVSP